VVAGTTHGGTLGVKWWKVVHGRLSLTIVMRGKPTVSMHRRAAVLGARGTVCVNRARTDQLQPVGSPLILAGSRRAEAHG
jgi:hypothetical protein